MASDQGRLLLLCHSGQWDRLYQAASAAASAASVGRGVDLVFFFDALDKLLTDGIDTLDGPPERVGVWAERLESGATRPVSELLQGARDSGLVRTLACSASVALTDHDLEQAAARVDEIVGWPTIVRLMDAARHVLYL